LERQPRENYLAIWNGRRGSERNPGNYRREDDGAHPVSGEDAYEWWYFDASFDNGYHAVVTFHYRNVFLRPMIPTVQFMIYRPDGTQVARYEACGAGEIHAAREFCDVRMGRNWVRDCGDRYELFMAIRDASVNLRLRNRVPGWKAATGYLYRDETPGRVSGWVVPVPHGEVEGELRIGDEVIPVKGSGYHDHNWGNYRFHETFHSWYWGRIHNDAWTVVYGWVIPQDPEAPVVSPLLVARKDEIVLSTNMLRAELTDPETDGRTGKQFMKSLRLDCATEGVDLSLCVRTTRTIEFMRMPKALPWDQYYYRFLADYTLNLKVDGVPSSASGEFLHEMMIL
jgi:predicted secreted hydrolase